MAHMSAHPVPRRELLRLAGAGVLAGIASACGLGRLNDEPAADPAAARLLHASGRFLARPSPTSRCRGEPRGLIRLGLSASERDGVLYLPSGSRLEQPSPLLVVLHGATGSGRAAIRRLERLAEDLGVILLAPDSRAYTWDIVLGRFGPDVDFVDRALASAFARCPVDPGRVAIGGFSDGASYALSLGVANGDLFSRVIAFSPGFVADVDRRGSPRLFISHGTRDDILPIEICGRRIANDSRRLGYDVRFVEFDGGHAVPAEVAETAMDWLLAPP
jgi:phospholipase/carboxylesterase